ncbi:MAG: HAD family hydrolase [Thermoplasmataceae archaeon]
MITKNRALFIDRDGTINRDCPYCHKITDLHIYNDAVELMKDFQDRGYLIIIVTNQSGIDRRYFTVSQFQEFTGSLLNELRKQGIHVNGLYYCPHTPEAECNCRKPKTAMIDQAALDFNINLDDSFVVGDRDDLEGEMARRLGIPYRIMVH